MENHDHVWGIRLATGVGGSNYRCSRCGLEGGAMLGETPDGPCPGAEKTYVVDGSTDGEAWVELARGDLTRVQARLVDVRGWAKIRVLPVSAARVVGELPEVRERVGFQAQDGTRYDLNVDTDLPDADGKATLAEDIAAGVVGQSGGMSTLAPIMLHLVQVFEPDRPQKALLSDGLEAAYKIGRRAGQYEARERISFQAQDGTRYNLNVDTAELPAGVREGRPLTPSPPDPVSPGQATAGAGDSGKGPSDTPAGRKVLAERARCAALAESLVRMIREGAASEAVDSMCEGPLPPTILELVGGFDEASLSSWCDVLERRTGNGRQLKELLDRSDRARITALSRQYEQAELHRLGRDVARAGA